MLVYAAARAVTTVIVLAARERAGRQPVDRRASPGYFEYANIWDARWYQIIALTGYPRELPLTDDGHVAENAWAFLPGVPGARRACSRWLAVPWNVAVRRRSPSPRASAPPWCSTG